MYMILNKHLRVSLSIWIVSKSLFKAWTIREVARNARMPVSTVSEVLKHDYILLVESISGLIIGSLVLFL